MVVEDRYPNSSRTTAERSPAKPTEQDSVDRTVGNRQTCPNGRHAPYGQSVLVASISISQLLGSLDDDD